MQKQFIIILIALMSWIVLTKHDLKAQNQDFLKKSWIEYDLFSPEKQITRQKPINCPVYDSANPGYVSGNVNFREPESTKSTEGEDSTLLLPFQQAKENQFKSNQTSFSFYDNNIALTYDRKMKFVLPTIIDKNVIIKAWEDLRGANYTGLLSRLGQLKKTMQLNDWAYFKLVSSVSEAINKDLNSSRFLSWYLMLYSGYNMRIGFNNNQLYCLIPYQTAICEEPYFASGALSYYIYGGNPTTIETYNEDFMAGGKVIDLSFNKSINLGSKVSQKNINFTYKGRSYKLALKYDDQVVRFCRDYPVTDMDIYFSSSPSKIAKESLIENLSPLVAGKPDYEAVSLLLKFTQTSFAYKTDMEQYGRDKYNIPDETLAMPYSDSDDRTVLFTWLVRELLHLKIAVLEYPDHVVTAIHFKQYIEGDYYYWKDEIFTVCDPTCRNAPVGRSLPGYRNKEARVILPR